MAAREPGGLGMTDEQHEADLVKCAEQINEGWQRRFDAEVVPLRALVEQMREALRRCRPYVFAQVQPNARGQAARWLLQDLDALAAVPDRNEDEERSWEQVMAERGQLPDAEIVPGFPDPEEDA